MFEIYPNGDPHSLAWDCTEFDEPTARTYYRGDLAHRFGKRGLVQHLRRHYPGCVIRYRESGRLVRMGR